MADIACALKMLILSVPGDAAASSSARLSRKVSLLRVTRNAGPKNSAPAHARKRLVRECVARAGRALGADGLAWDGRIQELQGLNVTRGNPKQNPKSLNSMYLFSCCCS